MAWLKSWAEWIEADTAHLSVPFTWLLPRVGMRASAFRQQGLRVRAGGPAVTLCPDRLPDFVEIGGEIPALGHHNPDATFTSRGCIRQCAFCAVPRIEGGLVELAEWEPKPIVCDNNLLACSRRHFDRVIDCLKSLKGVDFNQGLDARLLTSYHAGRLAELDLAVARLSWDRMEDESHVMGALGLLREAGFPKRRTRAYVLIGYDDSPADALYRLETLRGYGVRPFAQRYQPLTTDKKDSYVSPGWTQGELRAFSRYWTQLRRFEHIPFVEFRHWGLQRAALAR